MRLRKNMKRTAAAVLALSMAVSAVAAPASAAYICDVSQGNVEVSVDTEGNKSIKVGGVAVEDNGDGKDEIIITGDNTKSTASLNAEEENTSEAEKSAEVEKSGENTSEVEKSGEDTAEAEKTGEDTGETEEQAQEPGSLELLAPEDEEKQAQEKETQEKPADSQEPEQTEKTSDQVIEYGQYDAEAQQEAAKPAAKPAAEQETGEKKAAEEKTYEDTNAPTTLTEKAQEAARNVVKIINDYASPLKVILRNLKVDAGDTGKDAVKIEGTGDVTLELEGKNELTGGNSGDFGTRGITSGKGKLTIQGKEGSSLSTTGGSGTKGGSFGICATSGKLDLVNATVTATGGFGGGDGISANDEVNIKNSKLTAKGGGQLHPGEDTSTGGGTGISLFVKGKVVVGEGSEVIAIGGDHKTVKRSAWGGAALRFLGTGVGCGYEVQKGGKLTAIGGNAESKSGVVTGGDALNGTCGISGISGISGGIVSAGETTLIGGNAKSGSGKATGGNASFYDGNSNQVTVKGGTTTALGGKAEGADGKATNGSSIKTSRNGKIGLSVETGGTLVTAMPGERDGKGNGIIGNVEIKTNGGKIEEVENAKVVKKEDGSITVTGDLVGIKQDGHSYELTATVEPTCTTPGKRVYTCTTHVGETYEETIDALGHHFTERMEVVAPTYTSEGYTIYKCANCGETEKREFVPMLVPESNGGSSAVTLTVTGAGAYETSMAEGRYTIAVPAEAAVLSGCLSNLKELKAQGVNTLVFRTQLRETALNIDSMLSLGVDDTLFTLTHSGESAELTVGGFAHNELLN
ncbi:MAG: hypothetical protein ACLU96_02180 [Faecalibacterium prausnitzii]